MVPSSRVRVISSRRLSPTATPPPPPPGPPPKPSHLCKIAVVGDACSGKTALVQKFMHRRYANDSYASNNDGAEQCDGGDTNTNGGASAASNNSMGTSLGTATCEGLLEPTLADYHKKDITIWDQKKAQQTPVCVRVQLWDMNIHQYYLHNENDPDSNSVNSSSSSLPTPANMLLKRINGVLIVCRCPLPPQSFSLSSNASYASNASNASCSEWPELDLVEQRIRQWTTFLLDKLTGEKQQLRPPIFVMLSCADLAMAGYSPSKWMQLSVRMQDMCRSCGIYSWKMGSCMDSISNANIDDIISSQNQQSALLQRMLKQQNEILEEMEASTEEAFIDMIAMHLDRSKELR